MPPTKYYSPLLDRDLISPLYRLGRSRRVPMTRLASALIREGLARLNGDEEGSSTIREEPAAPDPGGPVQ